MLLPDVNVLVYAFNSRAEQHERYATWLREKLGGPEPLGMSTLVVSGFLRVSTHPRTAISADGLTSALRFAKAVLRAPSTRLVGPGPGHLPIFESFLDLPWVVGNVIPDAYLAAIAVEHGCTWVTADRGFARFPGLDWRHPFEG